MTSLADELRAYGIDYTDAMDRFDANESLFKRLALKYLDDAHFVNLKAALEVQDYEEAYHQAHSLKGVAGNLSLKRLYDASSMICKDLRDGEPQAAEKLIASVEDAHEAARKGLAVLESFS